MRPVRRGFRSDELKNLRDAKDVYDRGMRDVEAALSVVANLCLAASHDVPGAYEQWVRARGVLFDLQYLRDMGAAALRASHSHINQQEAGGHVDA